MTTVLITGGAGFIGSWIVEAYLQEGARVVIVDDMSTARESNVPKNAVLERIDIRDRGLIDVFRRYDVQIVNHHAARADVRDAVKNPGVYLDINVSGGLNLLECCKRQDIKAFIFASSGGCSYGEALYVPTDEEHPIAPEDPYGTSKVCFEYYLKTYHHLYRIPYTTFRYPNVYGPRQNPFGEAGVISMFIKRMLRDEEVVIYGSGDQVRDFVHVRDIVSANILATQRCNNTTYNLGWGVGVSVNKLFGELRKISGYGKQAVYQSPRLGEINRSILGAAKAERELRWSPRVPLSTGLKETFDYIRTHEL